MGLGAAHQPLWISVSPGKVLMEDINGSQPWLSFRSTLGSCERTPMPWLVPIPEILPNFLRGGPQQWLLFYFLLFRATPPAFGNSQAGGQIRAAAATLCPSHSNARSLPHWARPGIEPVSSWILLGYLLLRHNRNFQTVPVFDDQFEEYWLDIL